jgi:hypothetical protein
VLTILLGPLLALFPKRWRDALPAALSSHWRLATVLSGLAESAIALLAMLDWYSYSMVTWVSRGMDSATSGNLPHEANEQEIGFAAVTLFAMHPLTWAIGYFAVEGTVRFLSAAFSQTSMGILPLYLVEKLTAKIFGCDTGSRKGSLATVSGNAASFGGAIKQKLLTATSAEVPDDLSFTRTGEDEILEIRSSRPKEGWLPPKIVRIQDTYYRLEASKNGAAPRPFVYVLRRLSAGVPGRSVLLYRPPTHSL